MYCPICNVKVAPCDPEKVKKGDQTYHGKCLRDEKKRYHATISPQLNFWEKFFFAIEKM